MEKNAFILQINKRALNVYGVNRYQMFFSSKYVYVLVFSGFVHTITYHMERNTAITITRHRTTTELLKIIIHSA
jgi:hypothetical protein